MPEPARPGPTPSDDFDPAALVSYGWNEAVAQQFRSLLTDPTLIPGRIARVDRGGYVVATATGEQRCHPARGGPAPGDQQPAAGDWVTARLDAGGGLFLDSLLPRRSVIKRRDPHLPFDQVLVANVDIVLVVHALDRPPKLRRMERALVMTWESGATPIVVLSKADLAPYGIEAPLERVRDVTAGVDVVVTSAATGAGIADLASRLPAGATVALVGESGAGKSTLVNSLLGEQRQDTGETSWVQARGKHTTTSRELVPLPGGAVLIDTPGLRKLGMWESPEGVTRTFGDIAALGEQCRFRDCAHDREPGCAVTAAVAAGELATKRLAGYRKLQRELAWLDSDLKAKRARARKDGRGYRRVRKGEESW